MLKLAKWSQACREITAWCQSPEQKNGRLENYSLRRKQKNLVSQGKQQAVNQVLVKDLNLPGGNLFFQKQIWCLPKVFDELLGTKPFSGTLQIKNCFTRFGSCPVRACTWIWLKLWNVMWRRCFYKGKHLEQIWKQQVLQQLINLYLGAFCP